MTPARFAACLLVLASMSVPAPGQNPRQAPLEVRLTAPLTSYTTAAGTEFGAVVIAPFRMNGRVRLLPGTTVFGVVRKATTVGLGLIHERAGLDLEFTGYELPDGRRFPIAARVRHVDNARESVTSKGRIQGILAASRPQSLVQGIWHRPNLAMPQRSFLGLTGASGRLWTEYSMGPLGAAGLFAARCALFRMPEPEIQLPRGTELKLVVTHMAEDAPEFPAPVHSVVERGLAEWLAAQPAQVTKANGRLAGDIIHLAFRGTREQLAQAFAAAGWVEPVPLTKSSFRLAYDAYTRQTGYPSAPVSKLLYLGAEPDLVFEKSLNTLSKRHHIRIWRAEFNGEEVWLGAATHDVGIGFESRQMTFTHRIYPRIDFERRKVLNDLQFAGCAGPAGYVERSMPAAGAGESRRTVTDGRLAVVTLRDCEPQPEQEPEGTGPLKPPKTRPLRLVRRMLLEGRQYVLRGNAYYWAYRAVAWRKTSREDTPWVEE
jgi:hypothetical protein